MSYPGENGSCATFHPICSLLCCLRRTRWGFPVLISLCMCGLCMLTLSTQILDVYIILLVAFLNPNFWTAVACSTVTSESFAIIAAEQRSPYLVKLSLLYGYQGLFWQNIFNSFCSTKVLRGRVLINMLYIKHECNAPAFCAGWSGCTSALGLYTHLSNWKDCLPLFSLCVCVKRSVATKIKSYNHSHVPEIQNMPLSHRNVSHLYTVIRSPRRATM